MNPLFRVAFSEPPADTVGFCFTMLAIAARGRYDAILDLEKVEGTSLDRERRLALVERFLCSGLDDMSVTGPDRMAFEHIIREAIKLIPPDGQAGPKLRLVP